VPSWAYLLIEQALILGIVTGFCLRPGASRRQARKEWEEDHPNLSWEDWKNR
jgi:hypothetical protein